MINRDLRGKKVALTGSTGGLGREICFSLAEMGAEIVMLDRNRQKSDALKAELRAEYKDIKITQIILDLQNIEDVKKATERLKEIKIDFFLHNAGAYSIPRKTASTGYDNVFMINFVSPYYMIRELSEDKSIKFSAVGSIAHNYSHIDVNDIDFKRRKSSALVYGNAKRYLMYALLEHFKGSDRISIVHPGITFTNITAHYPKLIFAIIKHPMKVIFMKPKRAAKSIIEGFFGSTPEYSWIGPEYFGIWGKPKKTKLKTSTPKEIAEIYKIAEEIYSKLIN